MVAALYMRAGAAAVAQLCMCCCCRWVCCCCLQAFYWVLFRLVVLPKVCHAGSSSEHAKAAHHERSKM
jgi:hypothetical protein